jgi:hypothetical protein
MGFIFGGRTGISGPEELARRRELAEALLARGMSRAPQNVGEGLTAIGAALGGRLSMERLQGQENDARAKASEEFNSLFPAAPVNAEPASYSPPDETLPDPIAEKPPTKKPVSITEYAGKGGSFEPVGNYVARDPSKVNQKLARVLAEAAKRTGRKVEAFSGFRPGSSGQHGGGNAIDVRLYDEAGNVIPNYQSSKGFREYEKLAQEVRRVQQEMYPEIGDQFRWGGYFSGPKGKYGAMDAMHFDLGGSPQRGMLGGSWEGGLNPQQRKMYPGVESAGMSLAPGGTPQQIQPAAAQGIQVADAGDSIDPRLIQAMSNPWLTDGQRQIVGALIEQQMKAGQPKDPIKAAEGDVFLDPYTYKPIYKGPGKTTDDIREYQYYVDQATAAGQNPMPFDQFQMAMKKSGATSINMNTGEPGDSKLRGKLQEKEAETWSQYQATAAQSGAIVQQLDVVDELAKFAPQGPITGRLAQAFPGFSSAGDAFKSIVTRIAPSFRVPGSGAQSDIEYDGFLSSLPRMQNSPGGNAIISQTLRAKSAIEMERGSIVDRYSNGEISAAEARRQMSELNKRSIMTPELQAMINANAGDVAPTEGRAEQKTDDPVYKAGDIVTLPDGKRYRFKGGDQYQLDESGNPLNWEELQ